MAVSITSTSGTLSHGSAVTIAGSGFGTKTTAAPLIWDDCMHGQATSARWSGGWPDSSALYTPDYRVAQRSIPMPHAHTTKYLTMCNYQNNNFNSGWNGIIWKNISVTPATTPAFVFFSFRMRLDASFNSGDNWKFVDYSQGTSPFTQNDPTHSNWYSEQAGGIDAGGLSINLNDDGDSLRPWNSTDFYADRYNYDSGNSPIGHWCRIEGLYKLTSANDGVIRYWQDGVATFDYSSTNPNPSYAALVHPTDKYVAGSRALGFGGYTRLQSTSNWWYFTDLYLDTSWSRVLIGTGSTYATRGACEIQIPTSWSSTSIGVTLNEGALSGLSGKYLYVIDSTGVVNTTGFLLTGVTDVPFAVSGDALQFTGLEPLAIEAPFSIPAAILIQHA